MSVIAYFCASKTTAYTRQKQGMNEIEEVLVPFCTFILSKRSYPSTASLIGMILSAMNLYFLSTFVCPDLLRAQFLTLVDVASVEVILELGGRSI